jgi:intracellular septation protein A
METKNESPLLNLLLNIIIPVVILTKFSGDEYLGAFYGLIIALAFPVIYGSIDFIKKKKTNMFSVLGLVSVLITGIIGLLELNAQWIAIKEAAIPFIIGAIVLISLKTPYPLFKKLLFNDAFINTELVYQKLDTEDKIQAFERKIKTSTYWLSVSFFFSSLLNFILAKMIVVSPSGTTAFNEEIGKMTAYSFPVIAVPSTVILMFILWDVFKTVQKLTDLKLEEIMKTNK